MNPKPDIRTVKDLKKLNPCARSLEWLAKNGITDLADAWDRCHRSDWMLWLSNALDLLSDRDRRMIACRFVRETPLIDGRKVWDLLEEESSHQAVAVAEMYAAGEATDEQLTTAAEAAVVAEERADAAYATAANTAYAAAAMAAAYATAAAAAAADAVRADTAYAAASAAYAAAYAARAATVDAAVADAADAAATAAARAAQADIIRAIAGNPFRNSAA